MTPIWTVNCKSFGLCGILGGGCCSLGHHGGKPSFDQCQGCPHRTPRVVSLEAAVYDVRAVRVMPAVVQDGPRRVGCGGCGKKQVINPVPFKVI